MTTSPPDDSGTDDVGAGPAPEDDAAEESDVQPPEPSAAETTAQRFAEIVGASAWSGDHGNAKVEVEPDQWVGAVSAARDHGLEFFSFLSAIDWSNSSAVGEDLEDPVEERYEVLVRLSSVRSNDALTFATNIPKDQPRLPTLTGVFGGAAWHERETSEMFGIEFDGHPNPSKLYLPDAFEGYPLRKSYPLLSREVKPWPGMVDVEDQPSTENPEATDPAAEPEAGGEDGE